MLAPLIPGTCRVTVDVPDRPGTPDFQLAGAALRAGRRVVGMRIMKFMPRSPADVSLARLVVDAVVGVR
jgi:hypothetical protein